MRGFLRASVALVVILLMGGTGWLSRGTVHALVDLPTFGEPTVSGVQGYGFEEDVRVDAASTSPYKGTIYTSAPDSLSSGTSFLWRSIDGGQTFKWAPAAVQPQGKVPTSCVLAGGDTELATDAAGRVYFNDLSLANFSTYVSTDRAQTFPYTSCAGVTDAAVDRQWYAVDGDPANGGHIFLAYDRVAQSTPVNCAAGGTSSAGNNLLVLAQSPATGVIPGDPTSGVEFAPSQAVSCDEGIMGNDEYFKYGSGTNPEKVFDVHDSADFHKVYMARCDVVPVSAGTPTGFTNCIDTTISSFPNAVTGGNFVVMGVDKAGGLMAVWEQAPLTPTTANPATKNPGSSALYYSVSTPASEGTVWSTPQPLNLTLPNSAGTLQNAWGAWVAGGDQGKFDLAFYGTTTPCDQACVDAGGGPDQLPNSARWSIYMMQTLDNGTSWTQPLLASEHFVHAGNIQSVMGGQKGNRTLGDFMQLRIGPDGGAYMSYADSDNLTSVDTPQAMFVRQVGGPSVYGGDVTGAGKRPTSNSVTDLSGDGTLDTGGVSSSNIPELDITGSNIQEVTYNNNPAYKVTMNVADLTNLQLPALTNATSAIGNYEEWLTQWHVPSTTDNNGGAVFFVYMEYQPASMNTSAQVVCYTGQNASMANGGGIMITYPGSTQIDDTAKTGICSYTPTKPGTITITVPESLVTEPGAIDNRLYSVVPTTMLLTAPGNSVPNNGGLGGIPPSLVDVAPTYDFDPNVVTASAISRFRVSRGNGKLQATWRLTTHSGIAGFNVLSGRRALNRNLIALHAGRTYRFTATTRARGPYTLQVLLTNGRQMAVGQK